MHRRLAITIFFFLVAAFFSTSVRTHAQPTTAELPTEIWNLQVCGSANRIWYALSTPGTQGSPPHTYIRSRALQEDWQELVDFPNRVLSMGSNGTELLVAMEGGEWARVVGDQFVAGAPLPGRGDILAIAADPQGAWAIGSAIPTATTAPATASASGPIITTKPSTVGEWSLFRLEGDHWNLITQLPRQISVVQETDLSLGVVNKIPVLAYRRNDKTVGLIQWDANAWKSLGSIESTFSIRKMTLLELDGKLLMWAVADDGAGTLFTNDAGSWKSRPLKFASTFPVIDSAIAAFNGELRLLAIGPHELFQEQRYDAVGQPLGHAAEVQTPADSNDVTPKELLNWSALGLLIIITLASTQRGSNLKEVKVKTGKVALAPLSLRLAAGLIDLWPMYLLAFLLVGHVHRGLVPSEYFTDRFTLLALVSCLAVYVLHPLVAEWIWGRSLGKMFVGLSVLSAEGQPPTRQAIVLRNLLRLVEGPMLLGAPLLAICFTPLRQRVGDMLAGTIVVAKNSKKTEEEPA